MRVAVRTSRQDVLEWCPSQDEPGATWPPFLHTPLLSCHSSFFLLWVFPSNRQKC
ncbi:unnamed protein product [Gulo gulo]|uniref:Uncharacterized protein n=1 Tax=Gulo gulo TaxID=48420 RepID=A0A9X9PVD8_GULGU|nr:unnamed protein product [Gulo gulo]